MNAAQAHRGPDDEGEWVDANAGIALGFRRLAILDLSPLGAQPMASESGRYRMVFNGEVYNYRELRAELEPAGFRFRGGSDTEVILAAFEQWGVQRAVSRFVGMFAIALWDTHGRELHLLRDRIGKKPLHVYAGAGVVAFASELKSLLSLPWVERSLDRDALEQYLRYLYVPAPHSIFAGITKLPPGHVLTLRDPSHMPSPVPYWDAAAVAARGQADLLDGSDAEVIDEAERLLTDAARLRLRSDVPLGAFLSGGIDSSLTVALMQAASPTPVRTFAIGFDNAAHDESAHAAAVAKHLGTQHTAIQLSGADAQALVPRMAEVFDEPFADASQLPTLLICEAARKSGLVVAISGDGGDEVFAGYNRYLAGEKLLQNVLRVPVPARRLLAAGLRSVPVAAWDRLHGAVAPGLPGAYSTQRLAGEKLHKMAAVLPLAGFPQMYRALMSAAWQQPEALVRGGRGSVDPIEHALAGGVGHDPLSRMMLADQKTYLPDDLLAKVDRASMAVSLEVRVPLLDHRVIELSWRMPRRFKVRDGRSKWILRELLARHVPPSLTERPKVGFTVPIEQWLRGALRPWAEELLAPQRLERSGMLRAQPIRQAWNELQQGRGRWANAIWAVLMYQAWEERWCA